MKDSGEKAYRVDEEVGFLGELGKNQIGSDGCLLIWKAQFEWSRCVKGSPIQSRVDTRDFMLTINSVDLDESTFPELIDNSASPVVSIDL